MLVEAVVDYRRAKHFLRGGLRCTLADGERSDVVHINRQVRAVLLDSRHRQQDGLSLLRRMPHFRPGELFVAPFRHGFPFLERSAGNCFRSKYKEV